MAVKTQDRQTVVPVKVVPVLENKREGVDYPR
jgi:hypothetical protein